MSAINEYAKRMQDLRAVKEESIGIALRRSITVDTLPRGEHRDRQRRVVREALVVAAAASFALGEHGSVRLALSNIAKEHGIVLIGH